MTKEEMLELRTMIKEVVSEELTPINKTLKEHGNKLESIDNRLEKVESNTNYVLKWVDGIDQDVKDLKLVQ